MSDEQIKEKEDEVPVRLSDDKEIGDADCGDDSLAQERESSSGQQGW